MAIANLQTCDKPVPRVNAKRLPYPSQQPNFGENTRHLLNAFNFESRPSRFRLGPFTFAFPAARLIPRRSRCMQPKAPPRQALLGNSSGGNFASDSGPSLSWRRIAVHPGNKERMVPTGPRSKLAQFSRQRRADWSASRARDIDNSGGPVDASGGSYKATTKSSQGLLKELHFVVPAAKYQDIV